MQWCAKSGNGKVGILKSELMNNATNKNVDQVIPAPFLA